MRSKIYNLILLTQYFIEHEGIRQKLLKFYSLKNETSKSITKYCIDTFRQLRIPLDKIIVFCKDDTNIKFGGLKRCRQCNVFNKIKEDLEKPVEDMGCPAHILHNTISNATGILFVDVEVIVHKIFKYSYFAIYIVRTENLKEFCLFVHINH